MTKSLLQSSTALNVAMYLLLKIDQKKDDFLGEGSNSLTTLDNMLNDSVKTAGCRCKDLECVGQDRYFDPVTGVTTTVRSILRKFMKSASVIEVSNSDDNEDARVEKFFTRFVLGNTKFAV